MLIDNFKMLKKHYNYLIRHNFGTQKSLLANTYTECNIKNFSL